MLKKYEMSVNSLSKDMFRALLNGFIFGFLLLYAYTKLSEHSDTVDVIR